MLDSDTIVAQATPPGRGGVAIVRVSGVTALQIGLALSGRTSTDSLQPRYATFTSIFAEHQNIIDEGLVLYFPGPHSFTGEDVVEIHGHGGPYVVQQIIARCSQLGARQANPGEFTLRAFLNDKIDLAQAEAIADLIDARSVEAAHCAMASLSGAFSSEIDSLAHELMNIRIYVEAAMDFPEEEIDFLQDKSLQQKIDQFLVNLSVLLAQSEQGVKLRDGLSVAILGAPNAGKSSLLNRLSGDNTAIVTEIAGTTRDLLKCDLTIAGYPIQVIDTAGLRETENLVEQEGIRRAKSAAEQAEHVFFMIDARTLQPDQNLEQGIKSDLLNSLELDQSKVTLLVNKIDQLPAEQLNYLRKLAQPNIIFLSVTTGAGFEDLQARIELLAGGRAEESAFTARQRHILALKRTFTYCQEGYQQLSRTGSGELFAEDLKLAHQTLGEITGKVSSDDLLGQIFSSFCIGK